MVIRVRGSGRGILLRRRKVLVLHQELLNFRLAVLLEDRVDSKIIGHSRLGGQLIVVLVDLNPGARGGNVVD